MVVAVVCSNYRVAIMLSVTLVHCLLMHLLCKWVLLFDLGFVL